MIRQQWTAQLNQQPGALVRLAILTGDLAAWQSMLSKACQTDAPADARLRCVRLLGDRPLPLMIEPLLERVQDNQEAVSLRAEMVRVLAKIDHPLIADRLMDLVRTATAAELHSVAYEALFSRQNWAKIWLAAVDAGSCSTQGPTLDQVRGLAAYGDNQIDLWLTKHWGRLQGATREEKLAEVRRLNNDLRASSGQIESGRELFKQHCAACHRLFGEGGQLGPDLTTANRENRDFLLVSLVDPSSTIRKEYLSSIVRTQDDRVYTGIVQTNDKGLLRIVNAKNEATLLAAEEIADVRQSSVSMMPEDLYRVFSPQQLRDLFAYLQAPQTPAPK